MTNKDKVRTAIADAIIQTLWTKGLITKPEHDRIRAAAKETLEQNC